MADKIIVLVTCETKDQATAIAEAVINEKLAACVTLLPGIRACYVWKEKLTWSDEVLLLIKTIRGRFDELQLRIKAMHTYEVPEIVCVQIDDGSKDYLDWIEASVGA